MKRLMLIGSVGSGKTTLIQAIQKQKLEYKKTQALEYHEALIDTPGEFLESRRFYHALMTTSYDCHIIAFVQDSTSKSCLFPPDFAASFPKTVIGIITKVDSELANLQLANECLKFAGVERIFQVSSLKMTGLNSLEEFIRL